MSWLLTSSLLILGLTVVGGLLPLWFSRTSRFLHLLVSLAAGLFLGAVFLHLLPEVAGGGHHLLPDGHVGGGGHEGEAPWLAVVAGVLVLYFVEQLFLRGEPIAHAHVHVPHAPGAEGATGPTESATIHEHVHDHAPVHSRDLGDPADSRADHLAHQPVPLLVDDPLCHEDHIAGDDRHRMVGLAAFIGLSLHAVADGLGLSAGVQAPELRGALTTAIVSHKLLGGFSLAIALLLTGMSARRVVQLVALFALVTPLAAVGTATLLPDLGAEAHHVMTAFAAGTFLYVALCDLLPEVFHERRDGFAKAALLVLGVALSHLLHAH